MCVTHKNNTVTHRRQVDQGGPWTGWTNLGAPDAGAIANPALILRLRGLPEPPAVAPGQGRDDHAPADG